MHSLTEWIREHSFAATGAAIAMLALAAGLIYLQLGRGGESQGSTVGRWFYDPNQGELIQLKADSLPPAAISTGEKPAVQARLFTCGDCNTRSRFIGWLEKYTPQGKRRIEGFAGQAPPDALAELSGSNLLIAAPLGEGETADGLRWYGWETAAGRRIREAVHARCDDGEAKECLPR